jgi:hypothetical protein
MFPDLPQHDHAHLIISYLDNLSGPDQRRPGSFANFIYTITHHITMPFTTLTNTSARAETIRNYLPWFNFNTLEDLRDDHIQLHLAFILLVVVIMVQIVVMIRQSMMMKRKVWMLEITTNELMRREKSRMKKERVARGGSKEA